MLMAILVMMVIQVVVLLIILRKVSRYIASYDSANSVLLIGLLREVIINLTRLTRAMRK